MFADMFWKRDQKAGELEETYTAELKRLHGKVWPKQNLESTEEVYEWPTRQKGETAS